MQVYVHFAGKNHGPYSIDQLRQYVQAGSFKDDHLACYDGTNWVKIKDVPGFAVVAKKAKPVDASWNYSQTMNDPQSTQNDKNRALMDVYINRYKF